MPNFKTIHEGYLRLTNQVPDPDAEEEMDIDNKGVGNEDDEGKNNGSNSGGQGAFAGIDKDSDSSGAGNDSKKKGTKEPVAMPKMQGLPKEHAVLPVRRVGVPVGESLQSQKRPTSRRLLRRRRQRRQYHEIHKTSKFCQCQAKGYPCQSCCFRHLIVVYRKVA